MARIRALCASKRGETITEVLVAMLIGALSLLMFAIAISSSFNIVRDGENAMENYYEFANEFAVGGDSTAGVATIDGATAVPIDCYEWKDDDGGSEKVVSYTKDNG